MNCNPTAPTVLAAFLAGHTELDVYAEDGSVHLGRVTSASAPAGCSVAKDCVLTLETTDGTKGRPSGRFLIAVRRLDEGTPADKAVADAGGTL